MKIDSNVIAMQAEHTLQKTYAKEESLRMWAGNNRLELKSGSFAAIVDNLREDMVQISEAAKKKLAEAKEPDKELVGVQKDEEGVDLNSKESQKILLLETFIESLTGKECKIQIPSSVKMTTEGVQVEVGGTVLDIARQELAGGNGPVGWGIEYDSLEIYNETENLTFKAAGVINTKDGDSIKFSVEFAMNRSYSETVRTSIRAGDAVKKVDPLTINLDGATVSLTDAKYSFDLNADGRKEQISFVESGSGFLALDKNQDGVINNGSELFGPTTGNGFTELAQYDEDKNLWIDSSDSIYDKLRIWTKDAAGRDQLFALGKAGVGAIYLGNIQTPFELKDGQNDLNGLLNRTGIYVSTNKTVGTAQQVDLTV